MQTESDAGGRQQHLQHMQQEIIERRRAETALRESEERYHQLVQLCPDGIIVHCNGVVEFVNPAAVNLIGVLSASDLVGKSIYDFVHPEYRALLKNRSGALQNGEQLPVIEVKGTRSDGVEISCELLSVPFSYKGKPAVQAVIRDITARKRAEEEQKKLQGERDELLERLQMQMEYMPVAFLLTDTEFRTTYWNPAAERIFGFTKEEVIGNYGHKLIVPDGSRAFLEGIFNQVAGGEASSGSYSENITKDGRRITCEWYVVALKKPDGTFMGMMCMAQDVTDSRQAEQSLREANERALRDYERLLERIALLGQTLGNARDLTIIFRALRDFSVVSVPCDGMIISLYDPEKKTRKPAYFWVDGAEIETGDFEFPVREGSTGRSIRTGEVVIQNHFDEEMNCRSLVTIGDCSEGRVPLSALIAPMIVMGRTVGCVEIQSYQAQVFNEEHATAMRMAANLAATALETVRLIERERSSEAQLRQSQKMEAIGQLAGGVAHDFNNLLTGIIGYSELALRRLSADDPVCRNVEEIKKAGQRAAGLTRQLLAFSRQQMLQAKVLDLNSIVRDMDQLLQRLIGEDIDLVSLLKPVLGQVKADPSQVEQVLLNLVVNARDAMPKGGKITIETGHAYLDEVYMREHVSVPPGHYVVLSVSDTGAGMSAETQKRIFDPFFTTKEVGKGTGLGLSTVYGIVKQSEGNIWVYSEIGSGTTFKIYLPRVDEVGADDELAAGAQASVRGSETILLVEDEELVRNLSLEILQDSGYTVIPAANGVEGLRICKEFQRSIDLMITDVVMPQMGGRELAEHLMKLRPDTKVLFMSGYTDDAIVRHGILDDNVSFIQKPFSPDLLAAKAREVLDRR